MSLTSARMEEMLAGVHTGLSVVFREGRLSWGGWAKDVADREAERILKSTSSLH